MPYQDVGALYGASRLATATFVQGPGSGEIVGGKKLKFTDVRENSERPACIWRHKNVTK